MREVLVSATATPVSEVVYEVARDERTGMNVPARIIADAELMGQIARDHSIEQLLNVTTLPGVWGCVVGMPDMHEGYGFPVGGVAATVTPDGVISPGGIGFDINCGVRLLASKLTRVQVSRVLESLVHELSRSIPTGFGRHGRLSLTEEELDNVLNEGCRYVVGTLGLGFSDDLERIESGGALPGADASKVSVRAKQRGHDQLGTLGGGNHFIEVQEVETIFDSEAASALGLFLGQLTILIHTGSRGLGHQVCTDHVRAMDSSLARYGIELPDRQLACAPFSSAEGQEYFSAMCAAANFAWSNRQVLTHRARTVAERVLAGVGDSELEVVYDVAHNIAKLEEYGGRRLCVHRKGATRAFGPGSPELPERYRHVGQPVFIPGSMGTRSFVLVGAAASADLSFGSCCHGAGRALSRHAAKRQVEGHVLRKELEAQGIVVRCPSNAELAEEAPVAYKDVERVVHVVAKAGIARKVARLRPWGVLKG
jgi:tRNA-splicing ligase RtcB (3'-phosphate/5'-hydroxy nucleic acid ligase)